MSDIDEVRAHLSEHPRWLAAIEELERQRNNAQQSERVERERRTAAVYVEIQNRDARIATLEEALRSYPGILDDSALAAWEQRIGAVLGSSNTALDRREEAK